MNEIKPVQIVTIKDIKPLFKLEEKAERIELIELEEVGFDLVTQKGLYQIGDKAVYIQPDYCLSDIPLFESFIRPNGDESKSMLGKVGGEPRRIRAKKFNFSKESYGDAVYSNGVLLPINEVQNYLISQGQWQLLKSDWSNITELLNITKYEAPEDGRGGGVNSSGKQKPWMENVYKTDETNIHNLWGKLEFPIELVGTEKVDGSSITLGVMELEEVICSRNIRKSLTIRKHTGRRNKTFIEKICFWKTPDLNIFEEVPNTDDDFVKFGKPYVDVMMDFVQQQILLRGELNGSHLKGSGNKNNPSRNEKPNIKFFGVDIINDSGFAEKLPHNIFIEYIGHLNRVQDKVKFERVKEVFNRTFESKEDLIETCESYFKDNLIEGIVIRTLDSKFSCKFMNNEYDAKK